MEITLKSVITYRQRIEFGLVIAKEILGHDYEWNEMSDILDMDISYSYIIAEDVFEYMDCTEDVYDEIIKKNGNYIPFYTK